MKTILPGIILIISLGTSFAQPADSLLVKSAYEQAWDVAMKDSIISADEKALLNIIEAQPTAVDHSKALKPQLTNIHGKTLNQSGRWPLVMQNIAIGSGLYGWGIPYVLHAEDDRWYVGGVMISAGSAFYLTHKYTKNMEMSHARTQMMRYGSLVGLRYGLGLNAILGLSDGLDDVELEETTDPETLWMWVLMGSVPVGHYTGEYMFEKFNPTNGQAWVWSMWTGISGMTARQLYTALGGRPDEPDAIEEPDWDSPFVDIAQHELDMAKFNVDMEKWNEEMEKWDKPLALIEFVAYPVGATIGHYIVKDKQYSFGDAFMLIQGWGFGAINTMMLQSILFEEGDDDVFQLVSLIGAIGHTYIYDQWIAKDDFTFGQSTLMMLGSGSGIAFGFGTAILLDITDKEPMLTMALAGYGVGSWFTRKILDVTPNGSLTTNNSNRISLNPTAMTTRNSDNKLSLIPALELNISFK